MLRLEGEREALIEERLSPRGHLQCVRAAAARLAALLPALAAWLRADALALPALNKDWGSHVGAAAHTQHRHLTRLLEFGVPGAVDHFAVCLKQRAGCCEDAAGLAEWTASLFVWLQLRNALQVAPRPARCPRCVDPATRSRAVTLCLSVVSALRPRLHTRADACRRTASAAGWTRRAHALSRGPPRTSQQAPRRLLRRCTRGPCCSVTAAV